MTLITRDLVLGLGVFVAAAIAAAMALEPSALPAVIGFPAALAAVVLAYGLLRGSPAALLLQMSATVFLMQAVFRIRDYQDKDVDFQVILKIALWVLAAAVAVVHGRRWLAILLKPANLPALLFLLWLPVTAVVSSNPTYTLVSSFTILACVVFCACSFARLDRIDVFAAMIAAITLFCIVSIIVYFAIPEFGHYVYWVNEERYVSGRLSGIAGSANNMALISSLALVLTSLEARAFHRLHPLIIPVVFMICGAALVMTNSRTALLIAVVIIAMSFLLSWKRAYAVVFAASAGLILFAVLVPFGQEALLKAVSRSGSVGEVTSLTGRTEIWYAVLKLWEMRPWMGYGYGSSVFVLPDHAGDVGFTTSHAHNLLLQLLLTTGVIGAALFALSALGIFLRAIVHRDRTMFGMIAFVILNGITESSGFTTLANACSLAFAIAVTLPPRQRDHEDDRPYQR